VPDRESLVEGDRETIGPNYGYDYIAQLHRKLNVGSEPMNSSSRKDIIAPPPARGLHQQGTRKSPARFPVRAHFVSFNFTNRAPRTISQFSVLSGA
jgi:hypothetical protein